MRRARIIHVLHRMGAGGTELALRKVVAGLDADRFEHTICTVAPVPETERSGDVRFLSLERGGKKTGSLVADLAEVAAAMRLLGERNRIVAEGAGACPVACALANKAGTGKIVCVVSGGNIDLKKLATIFNDQLP